ncbi:uncharacterized protein [Argopecten irradians]|uniref:uncharacterized protein n=1 Tax=Argopecten irradians TaxID=31199 RepID=UPI00371BD4D8
MDGLQKKAVQQTFTFLVNYVDPLHIIAQLYEQEAVTQEVMKQILHDNVRHKRAMIFFVEIVNTCPFDVLIDCMKKTQHGFVAEKLLEQYHQLVTKQNAFVQPGILHMVDIPHGRYIGEELALFLENGEIDKFEWNVFSIVSKWYVEYKSMTPSIEKSRVARVVMDAKTAWIKFLVEAGQKCDILAEIDDVKNMTVQTDNPVTSLCKVLAYQAQMMMIQKKGDIDGTLHEYKRIKAKAESERLDAFEATRFYITDFLIDYRSYERTGKREIKDRIKTSLDKMTDLADRLADRNEAVKEHLSVYVRRCQLVKLLLYLGMTHKGKLLPGPVSEEDLKSAKSDLEQTCRDGEFENLKKGWKMMVHVAQARLRQLEGNHEGAFQQAKFAKDLSNQLEHRFEERQNITELLENIHSTRTNP